MQTLQPVTTRITLAGFTSSSLSGWNHSQLISNQRHIHTVEVKPCKETKPRSHLKAAKKRHTVLCQHLCQAAAGVRLHAALLGVGGTMSSPHSMESLKDLDPQIATKLAIKLNAHSLQYTYKLVASGTKRA